MKDILKLYQDAAIKYPKLGTNTGVCEMSDGTQKINEEVGCHGYMSGWMIHGAGGLNYEDYPVTPSTSKPVAYYTSLWSHDYSDDVLEYFRFLCNKQFSPWREHIKGSEVLWGKKGDKDIPVAVKLTDMTASPQAVLNFMLACRMAYAQPGLITCYGKLRKAGFTRTESVFLSASFGLNKSNTPNWPYIGDYPYDTSFADMSWDAWKSGKPRVRPDNTLLVGGNTKPINAIWNEDTNKKSGIVIVSAYNKKNNRICDLISEERTITNMFGKTETRRFPLSFDDAVKKLKDNQEVWKCQPATQESTSQAEAASEKTPSNSINSWGDGVTQWSAQPISSTMPLYFTVPASVSPLFSTGSFQ